jgi:hypothetical protein
MWGQSDLAKGSACRRRKESRHSNNTNTAHEKYANELPSTYNHNHNHRQAQRGKA